MENSIFDKFNNRITESKKFIPAIEKGLLETYYKDFAPEFFTTELGKKDIYNNVFGRYENSLRHVVPWLSRQVDFNNKTVLEIGCGTGSSSAALAHYVKYLQGYDIKPHAVEGARKRLEIMQLDNVDLHVTEPASLIDQITSSSHSQFDIILLFAVLEHQTVEERHETLKTCWDILSDGGIMAVVESPNILQYFDGHTTKLPFMHMLPNRLYAKYAAKSPREGLPKFYKDEALKTDKQIDLEITRWGRGISYHDFELTLGDDYSSYLVSEGFEPEMLNWFGPTVEEELLRWYVQQKKINIPLGLTRSVLNLIFKKSLPVNREKLPEIHVPPENMWLVDTSDDLLHKYKLLRFELQQKKKELALITNSATWKTRKLFVEPCKNLLKMLRK